MRGELPQFKRCCCCVPLRSGLLCWGYVKLVLSILLFIYMIMVSLFIVSRQALIENPIMIFILISLLLDVSLNILFIVAGHKKSVKLLSISFIHNLIWLGLLLAGNCFQLYQNIGYLFRLWVLPGYRMHLVFDLLIGLALAFSSIFVQVYLILLIRSERIKLLNETLEMQFSNNITTGEPQCTVHDASVTDQRTDKDAQAVQDNTGKDAQAVQDCTDEQRRKRGGYYSLVRE